MSQNLKKTKKQAKQQKQQNNVDNRIAKIVAYSTKKTVHIDVHGQGKEVLKLLLAICDDVDGFDTMVRACVSILNKQEIKEEKTAIKNKIII